MDLTQILFFQGSVCRGYLSFRVGNGLMMVLCFVYLCDFRVWLLFLFGDKGLGVGYFFSWLYMFFSQLG